MVSQILASTVGLCLHHILEDFQIFHVAHDLTKSLSIRQPLL